MLCGECKQGLSNVFGSSQCKHCSNLYAFTIIPIAIAGIVLVIMLFTFNFTVTNGIINTLIFLSTSLALTIHNFVLTAIHQIVQYSPYSTLIWESKHVFMMV